MNLIRSFPEKAYAKCYCKTDMLDSFEKIFEYRLLKLGDSYLTVSGLLELLILFSVVLGAEWILRR